jgi:hypothetical protein
MSLDDRSTRNEESQETGANASFTSYTRDDTDDYSYALHEEGSGSVGTYTQTSLETISRNFDGDLVGGGSVHNHSTETFGYSSSGTFSLAGGGSFVPSSKAARPLGATMSPLADGGDRGLGEFDAAVFTADDENDDANGDQLPEPQAIAGGASMNGSGEGTSGQGNGASKSFSGSGDNGAIGRIGLPGSLDGTSFINEPPQLPDTARIPGVGGRMDDLAKAASREVEWHHLVPRSIFENPKYKALLESLFGKDYMKYCLGSA